jgi:Carboxypeptidase regulatory-like domain/TonB dependent receptor
MRILIISATAMFLTSTAAGQSTGTIQGTVTDPSNAAVSGANVTVRSQTTGVERSTRTDAAGAYLIAGLPPDIYRIQVSDQSFQTSVINNFKLDVATTATENVRLEVGAVSTSVEVTGGAPVVNTSNVSVSAVIPQKTVQDIPLNGRHFVDLVNLVPGTVTAPQNGFLADPLVGLGQLGVDTAGQRENTTNWMVNGINLNDAVQNQITFQPSIDTVSEFKVDNSTFPAEYGRNSGAIVNIATRSGTNQYHGEAFEYIRNNFFDARNYFNPVGKPQSQFNRSNFGADFGGLIVKDKAFYFLSYEGLRQHQGITLKTQLPPAGSVSPSATVNNLLALLPPPNGTITLSNGTTEPAFLGSASTPVTLNIGTGDVSVNLAAHDQLHGYYAIEVDHRFEPQAGGLNTVPGWGDTRDGRRQLLTIQENHEFGPSLTNSIRIGANRIHITFTPNGVFNPATIGIGLPSGVPEGVGLPLISIAAGTLTFGSPEGDPEGRGDTTVVLGDTVSWLKGRHSFNFGGEIRRFYNNNYFYNLGSFGYATFNNFVADQAQSFSVLDGNANNRILQPAWGLFAQDTYRLTSRLTLSLGLRYDWNSTPTAADNRFSVFDPATDALVQVGTPGFGQIYQTNNKNFQPRVGVIFDPRGDGRTSIRAGYAILTQQPVTNTASNLTQNPPFAIPLSATSSTSSIVLEAPPTAPKTVSPYTFDPNFKDAYAQDWNLTIQHAFTNATSLQVAYVGSRGTHLQQVLNQNQPAVVNGFYQSTVPFTIFSAITQYASNGFSTYNALWVTVNQQAWRGLQFSASYTFSKSLDEASLDIPNAEFLYPQNSYDLRADYGPSDFDARQRFVLSGFYTFPTTGNRAISGWEIALIQTAQSGNPLQPIFVSSTSAIFPGVNLRPNISGSLGVTGSPVQWFSDPGAFTSPCATAGLVTTCSPGDMGRNSVIGPDFVSTDLSLIKDTKLHERLNLQFRADAFDVLNRPNFGNPNLTVGSLTFGAITSTRFPNGDFGSARQLQLALKLQF